jgi:hypothetical protein
VGEVAEAPPAVVTVTVTVPDPAGAVTVSFVVATVCTVVARSAGPKSTKVEFARWLPLMVTVPPPAAGPLDGVTEVTTGAAT